MNKKRFFTFLLSIILLLGHIHADNNINNNDNTKDNQKYSIYHLRHFELVQFEPSGKIFTVKELKDSFLENSTSINLQELDNKIKEKQAINSENSKDDLNETIWEMDDDKREMEKAKKDIEEILAIDSKLPKTHPKKLPSQTRLSLYNKKDMLNDNIEAMEERISDLEKNYIMVDFKYESDKLNAEYNKNSLESFKKTELLNIDNKILDILENDTTRDMKEQELDFMKTLLNMQKKSYNLGYTDLNTLKEFESKVTICKNELSSIQKQLNAKLDDLSIICHTERIDGLKLNSAFFDTTLASKDLTYYKKSYKKNSYQLDLIDNQVKKMKTVNSQLDYRDDSQSDAELIESKADKASLQKKAIMDNVELGASKLISSYETLDSEKKKIALKITEAKRKKEANYKKFQLGYISKLDYTKSTFEYIQTDSSIRLINLKLKRIKNLLEAMASGIVQK